VISYVDQLGCKAVSLQQLDSKIQSIIEGVEDLEKDTFDAIEIQDLLIEKLTRLKRFLDQNNSTTHHLQSLTHQSQLFIHHLLVGYPN